MQIGRVNKFDFVFFSISTNLNENFIRNVKEQLNSQTQFFKYEVRLFIISFSKNLEELRRKGQSSKQIESTKIQFKQ